MKLAGEKCANEMINVSRAFDSRQNGSVDTCGFNVSDMILFHHF